MSVLANAKRIVVKVGTSTLTHETGLLHLRSIERLVRVLADLKNAGKEIVLVSSGAISVGVGELNLPARPTDTPTKQACAAIGQCELMYRYDKLFSEYNHKVAQVLLTRDGIDDPVRKQHIQNTFTRLLEMNVLPIVNENDTVSVEEIEFGDNDALSAIVGELIHADLLILLSDIDGLYDSDPHKNENAKLISHVETVTPEIRKLAGGSSSNRGTGGMYTKIQAVDHALEAGFPVVLLHGKKIEQLYDLLDGKPVGTLFGSPKNQ